MTPPADATASRDAPSVCSLLRSKGAGVVYGDPVTWEAGYVSTAVFWCLATADALGPDDGFVHPHACTGARLCFRDLGEHHSQTSEADPVITEHPAATSRLASEPPSTPPDR
jgi:hypothetical protein